MLRTHVGDYELVPVVRSDNSGHFTGNFCQQEAHARLGQRGERACTHTGSGTTVMFKNIPSHVRNYALPERHPLFRRPVGDRLDRRQEKVHIDQGTRSRLFRAFGWCIFRNPKRCLSVNRTLVLQKQCCRTVLQIVVV